MAKVAVRDARRDRKAFNHEIRLLEEISPSQRGCTVLASVICLRGKEGEMVQENSTGGGLNIDFAPSQTQPLPHHTPLVTREVSEWVWVEAPYGFLHWKICLEPIASTDSPSHTAQAE